MVDTRLQMSHHFGRTAGEEGELGNRGEAHGRWHRQIQRLYIKGSVNVFPRSSQRSLFTRRHIKYTGRDRTGNRRDCVTCSDSWNERDERMQLDLVPVTVLGIVELTGFLGHKGGSTVVRVAAGGVCGSGNVGVAVGGIGSSSNVRVAAGGIGGSGNVRVD